MVVKQGSHWDPKSAVSADSMLLSEDTQEGESPFVGCLLSPSTSWVLMSKLYKRRPPRDHAAVERFQDSARKPRINRRDDRSHSSTDRTLEEIHEMVLRWPQTRICSRTSGAFR